MELELEKMKDISAFGFLDAMEGWFEKAKEGDGDMGREGLTWERYINLGLGVARLEFVNEGKEEREVLLKLEVQALGDNVFNVGLWSGDLEEYVLCLVREEGAEAKELEKLGKYMKAYLLYGMRAAGMEVGGDVDSLMAEIRPGYKAKAAEAEVEQEAVAQE